MPLTAANSGPSADASAPPVVVHVEDHEATRFLVRRVLERAGFQVRAATTAAEAASLLGGADVALLDVHLPDGTGLELCARIKNGPPAGRIPVIIASATSVSGEDQAHGLDLGADAYLTHPVDPAVLTATVRALVRAGRAERERDDLIARLEQEAATSRALARAREVERQNLDRARLRLDRIYDSPLIGIAYAREDGIVEANDEFLRIVGYSRDDLARGLDWRAITPPEYAHLDDRALGQLKQTGRCDPFEKEYIRKDGTRVAIEIGAVLVGVGEWACFVLDISGRKKAESVQKHLLGMAGHDLRTPLMVVQTSIDLLERLPEDKRQPVRARIRAAAKRMLRITSDLLDFDAVEHGGTLRLHPAPVDLDEVCRGIIAEVQAAAPQRRIEYSAAGDARIVGDAARLAQLFDNLLSNAVKFSPEGSPVCVSRSSENGRVVLRVANSGPPIPEEARARVFDAFFRAPENGIHRSGAGLGLFIARAIAEAHGGSVSLACSDEERGTEFRVELPAR